METNRRSLIAVIAACAITMVLSGCGVSNALDGRDAEIIRLKYELIAQQGARAAELAHSERHVGMYRGCVVLFNFCSDETTQVAQELIKKGFTGDSSLWWWIPLIGKFVCVGGFLGALLWLPRHLYVKFTGPEQRKVDEANKLVFGMDAKTKAYNRELTQTQQALSAMKREFKQTHLEQQSILSALKEEVAMDRAADALAKADLAEVSRLRDSFKRF